MIYDIFISYRRKGGFETARLLHELLDNDGYIVSFDTENLGRGRFDIELLKRIDECTDFILVLNEGAFDKCFDPNVNKEDDWMRNELAYALEKGKNIIPVRLADFEFPTNNLPEDIAKVLLINGPLYSQPYFPAFYHCLKEVYLQSKANDYQSGKNKLNLLFVKRIIKAIKDLIKDDCSPKETKLCESIEKAGEIWEPSKILFLDSKQLIYERFGIIGTLIGKLFAIENKTIFTPKHYIDNCNYIVKRTLDLTVFVFVSQLWDDVCTSIIELSGNQSLSEDFTMDMDRKEHLAFLRRLIDIYRGMPMNHCPLFISDVLDIKDQFDETGELYSACLNLDKFGENPTFTDCFLAEKLLTVFFEKFRFLVNYKIASMKKIEFYNIKQIDNGYLYHYVHVGARKDSKSGEEDEERNFDNRIEKVNSLFTNAVLLYKGNDYMKNINLFPFVIDYNALTMEKKSRIAFFLQSSHLRDILKYTFLDTFLETSEIFELEYTGIAEKKDNKNTVFHSDNDIKIYNMDCVYSTFRKIEEILFT